MVNLLHHALTNCKNEQLQILWLFYLAKSMETNLALHYYRISQHMLVTFYLIYYSVIPFFWFNSPHFLSFYLLFPSFSLWLSIYTILTFIIWYTTNKLWDTYSNCENIRWGLRASSLIRQKGRTNMTSEEHWSNTK